MPKLTKVVDKPAMPAGEFEVESGFEITYKEWGLVASCDLVTGSIHITDLESKSSVARACPVDVIIILKNADCTRLAQEAFRFMGAIHNGVIL